MERKAQKRRLFNKKADAAMGTAIKVLTSVVLGAAIQAGTYSKVKTSVVPATQNKALSVFQVSNSTENDSSESEDDVSSSGGMIIRNPVTELERSGIIFEGCKYTLADGTVLSEGDSMPETPSDNDTYEEGDYIYTYNKRNGFGTKWSVALNLNVTDTTKTEYGEIISKIAKEPITNIRSLFNNCANLTVSPIIPNSVTSLAGTFNGCSSLVVAPIIPSKVTAMNGTFSRCTSLTTVPTIPKSVTNLNNAFNTCTSLSGVIGINANPTTYTGCFSNTVKPITITGYSANLDKLAKTATNGNVTVG